jgi:hypothetical protein
MKLDEGRWRMHWTQRYVPFIAKPHPVQKGLTTLITAHLLPLAQSSSLSSMNATQTQCPACKKKFTLSGYSQHVAKTQRADCRAVHAPSFSLFRAGPGAASQPLVDSGTPQAILNAPSSAARSPGDYQTHIIGHITDPNISVPRTNCMSFF